MSQEELAGRVGLNRGNIASYENGSAEPKICNLLKLSNLFGISIIDLTQKDLSNDSAYQEASTTFKKFSASEKELIIRYYKRSKEFDQVFDSIRTCYEFKVKELGELPQDMRFLQHNFHQLYDATQSLLRNHQNLLELLKCRMK